MINNVEEAENTYVAFDTQIINRFGRKDIYKLIQN